MKEFGGLQYGIYLGRVPAVRTRKNFAMHRLIFCLFLLPTFLNAQRMFPADAAEATVDELFEEINEKHPFSATDEGAKALEEARTQVQGKLKKAMKGRDSLSYPEFFSLVAPIQQVTGCGHLVLEPHLDSLEDIVIKENVFPLCMTSLEDGTYVLLKGLKTTVDSLPPGTRVISIDGHSLEPLLEGMAHFSGLNDQGNEHAAIAKIAFAPSGYYQRHYGFKKEITVEVVNDKGVKSSHLVLPVYRKYIDPKKVETDIHKTLSFRFSPDGKTGILKIKKFSSWKFFNGNYYKYIKKVFDTLQITNTQQLVIDIRDNTGGSNERINRLYAHISDREFRFATEVLLAGPHRAASGKGTEKARLKAAKSFSKKGRRLQRKLSRPIKPHKAKNRYNGKVVVLINEISFSASGIFARYVQGAGRGQLVGTTAGASAGITYGASGKRKPFYAGPADNFELKVNSIGLVPEYPVPGNVTPNHVVYPTAAGLRAGRDEQLERALEVMAIQ